MNDFRNLTDEFLLETWEKLCYRTNCDAVDPDGSMEEWQAAKDEILRRMKGVL